MKSSLTLRCCGRAASAILYQLPVRQARRRARRYMAQTQMKSLFVAILSLSMVLPSVAAEYERCYNAGNTIEINDCLSDEFGKIDQQLNQTYQKTIKGLTADSKKALTEAQRAWIQFRDKECLAVYEFWKAGTIRTTKAMVCRIEKTRRRISELRKWPPN
jgi:uncharacterized protein YecT (DUF1311 family)